MKRPSQHRPWGPVAALALLLVVGADLCAKEGILRTTDGRELVGDISGTDDKGVTVVVKGIATPVAATSISEITYIADVPVLFAARRAKLADDDIAGRYELAYWVFDKRAYSTALTELQDIQKKLTDKTPEDLKNRVNLLARVVAERQKIEQPAPAPASASAAPRTDAKAPAATTRPAASGAPSAIPGPTATTKPATTRPAGDKRPGGDIPALSERLTDEQINLIRIYEIDLESTPPPVVVVPKEAIDDLFKKYQDREGVPKGIEEQRLFRGLDGVVQLSTIFSVQARELYPKVKVRTDPPVLRSFRVDGTHTFVLNYCGSVGCHGGPAAGDLFLYRTEANVDRTVYTNFYTLNQYRNAAGRMIDRDQPRRSLLLQYALPKEVAATPHPNVAGWRPSFQTEDDARYTSVITWIDSLFKPEPNYGIDYTAPTPSNKTPTKPAAPAPGTPGTPAAGAGATTKPAGAPAKPR